MTSQLISDDPDLNRLRDIAYHEAGHAAALRHYNILCVASINYHESPYCGQSRYTGGQVSIPRHHGLRPFKLAVVAWAALIAMHRLYAGLHWQRDLKEFFEAQDGGQSISTSEKDRLWALSYKNTWLTCRIAAQLVARYWLPINQEAGELINHQVALRQCPKDDSFADLADGDPSAGLDSSRLAFMQALSAMERPGCKDRASRFDINRFNRAAAALP